MGWKHSPCVLREVTLRTQEGQNSSGVVSLCSRLISSVVLTPFGGIQSPLGLVLMQLLHPYLPLHCAATLKDSLLPLTQQFHTCDSALAGQAIYCHTIYICSNPASLSRPNQNSIPSVTPFPILPRETMTPSSSHSELSFIFLLRILAVSVKCCGYLFILYLLLLDWGHLEDKDH